MKHIQLPPYWMREQQGYNATYLWLLAALEFHKTAPLSIEQHAVSAQHTKADDNSLQQSRCNGTSCMCKLSKLILEAAPPCNVIVITLSLPAHLRFDPEIDPCTGVMPVSWGNCA